MSIIKTVLSSIIVLILFIPISDAQNSLTGKITDTKDGTALIGATVFIPDLKTGTASDIDGNYLIQNLPSGNFLVEVKYLGYSTITQRMSIKGVVRKDFTLSSSVVEINEVVVTGVSTATDIKHTVTPMSVISPKDLQLSSSPNLIDAIAKQPGISQVTTGAGISKPVIRGLGYNRVVVLNDGIRQEGQQWGDEHGIEIDEYSANKVEILKGPGSIMYGSDAMAGVINILSPDPVAPGQIKGNLLGNYQTNNGLIGYSASLTGNQNGFTWLGRFSGKMAHAYQNSYDGYVFNSNFNEMAGSGYVGLNKHWGYSHLNFSIYHFEPGLSEGERDSTGAFIKEVPLNDSTAEIVEATNDDFTSYTPLIPYQRVNHVKFSLMNNFYAGGSQLYVNVGFENNRRQEYPDALAPNSYGLYFYLNTIPYDVRWTLPETEHWNITFGVNGMYQKNENKGIEFLIPAYHLFDGGVFGFARGTFKKITVSGGLRFDNRNITTKNLFLNQNDVPVPALDSLSFVKFAAITSKFYSVSGSIGLSYEISQHWIVKANVSRGFRAPNIAELGANGRHEGTFRYEIGNPDLKAETSLQFDGGLGFSSNHVSGELSLFDNNISNFIFPEKLSSVFGGDSAIVDEGDAVPVYKFVQGNANLTGGEISIDIHPHPFDWVHFENSLSYVSAIQQNQPDSTKYLPFTPATKFTSELRGNFKKVNKLMHNAYVSVSVQHDFAKNNVYSAFSTETPTPAYTLLNAAIGTDFYSGNTKICSLIFIAANITDEAYQDHLSRLKYAPENPVTGRVGIFNMGRNFSIKLDIPIGIKK